MSTNTSNEAILTKDNKIFYVPENVIWPCKARVEKADIPRECHQHSTNMIKQHGRKFHNITFMTVDKDDMLELVVWFRPRMMCNLWDHTFWPHNYDLDERRKLDKLAANKIQRLFYENPTLHLNSIPKTIDVDIKIPDNIDIDEQSHKRIKETFSIANATVDRIVKERVDELTKHIEYIKCDTLYYLPFKYKSSKKQRNTNPNEQVLAVIGTNKGSENYYLLDILEGFDAETIKNLHKHAFFQKSENAPKYIYCNNNYEVLQALADYSKKHYDVLHKEDKRDCNENNYQPPGILTQYLIDRIKDFMQTNNLYSAHNEEALATLKAIVQKSEYNIHNYNERLYRWKVKYLTRDYFHNSLADAASLITHIEQYSANYVRGTQVKWAPEFSMLQSILKDYINAQIKFPYLRFRLLFANRLATKSIGNETIYKMMCIHSNCDDIRIKNFGINIRELYEAHQESQNILMKLRDFKGDNSNFAFLYKHNITLNNKGTSQCIGYKLPEFLQIEIDKLEALLANTEANGQQIQEQKMNLSSGIFAAENNLLISEECAKFLKEKYNL